MTSRRRTLLGLDVVTHETWHGTPGAPSVVLVHGIGVSSRYFTRLVAELARGATVLTLDLPGFGGSPGPDHVLDVPAHADVVAALVEDAGLDRPLLVGHSMGAQVVAELAVRRPDLTGGVVLLGPVADPRARSAVRQAARLLRDVAHEPFDGVAVQVREWMRTGLRRYLRTVPTMRDHPVEDAVGRLTVPVAVVRGASDPVAPSSWVHLLAARARDAVVVEIPGAAHLVMWSRPAAVADVCTQVLDRRAAR